MTEQKNGEMVYYEAHMDRMERERQSQQSELERTRLYEEQQTYRAKLEARADTKMMLGIIFSALMAAVVILGIVYAIYKGTRGPDEDALREQQREESCQADGGTWLPAEIMYGDAGFCIVPGQEVPDNVAVE